jgi:serralysin
MSVSWWSITVTIYYVATNGSDDGNGSANSPWRTISEAMQADLKPGDEVVVRSGTYNESVMISKDGSAAGYITLRSEVPGGAKIVATSDRPGIHIAADYVKVDGFEVSGSSKGGIIGHLVHHVEVTNSESHDNATHGISFTRSEFVKVEGNVTYGNASTGPYSGISVCLAENITEDTTSKGFRTIVRGNISYDNITKNGPHTDGNGIIVDDFQNHRGFGDRPGYDYPTLVENNIVYDNGGRGISVAWSDNVTVRNNTAWHNNVDPLASGTCHGELSNMGSNHTTWVNNIAVTNTNINKYNTAISNVSFGDDPNEGVVWHNNLTFNGTAGDASIRANNGNARPTAADGNMLGVDPKFVDAPSDLHLRPGSPAIDAGTDRHGLGSVDVDGDARVDGTVDIGADEAGTVGLGNDAPDSVALSGRTVAETASAGTVVGQLSAVDPDGDTVTFTVDGDPRFIVNGRGELVVAPGANLAVNGDQTVALTITANDGKGGVTSASTSISILDTAAGQSMHGDSGDNRLYGGAGSDKLYGYGGRDYLTGMGGGDVLQGGLGKDALIGGTGGDTFTFRSASQAGKGSERDVIRDFSHGQGDKIDLSAIDANTVSSGNQAFSLIGSNGFSGKAGELRYDYGIVSGDVNGDKAADFHIDITNDHALGSGDFLL